MVVPAYGNSPYLDACLDSLLAQEAPVRVVVSTSTPGPFLEAACARRGLVLQVHGPAGRGIGADWNAALARADGRGLVTIAHQDDVYEAAYAMRIQQAYRERPGAGLYFTDSYEIDPDGTSRPTGRVLAVKRLLAWLALIGADEVTEGWRLRMLLGLGNAIVCPAVTLNLDRLGRFAFREDLRTNMDWLAWRQAALHAPLRRVAGRLVGHRVHPDSETSRCIGDGSRRREDEMMFREFWPAPAAAVLARLYGAGYEAGKT
jgi:glycosyltransferase involved in cell wall biosynthesis